MRKIILNLSACMLLLASCTEQDTFEKVSHNNEALKFSTAIGKATKASEFTNASWSKDDVLNIHAYQSKEEGWKDYFNQDIKFDGAVWSLQGDPHFRLPYKSKYIAVFPTSLNSRYTTFNPDFATNFPTLNIDATDFIEGYFPDVIATSTDIPEMETNVNLEFRHLLSQINIGIQEVKDVKITVKDIRFVNLPSKGTYTFAPDANSNPGSWGTLDSPTTLTYKFSKNNSFTTSGNPIEGSYVFGDGGNFAAGEDFKYVHSDGTPYSKGSLPAKLDNSFMVLPDFSTTGTVIEFTYSATDMNGNPIGNFTNVKGTIDPSILGVTWKQNYRYLYMINFDFTNNQLKYQVTVGEWENYNVQGPNDGIVDSTVKPSEIISFVIYPDDPNLIITGAGTITYTIPVNHLPNLPDKNLGIALIFSDNSNKEFIEQITINIPANLPVNFTEIMVDAHLVKNHLTFLVDNPGYSGTLSFGDYYATGATAYLGSLNINLPKGSVTIGQYVVDNDLTIISAPSTFLLTDNAVVKGDLFMNGGRAVINGLVNGEIYAKGNTQVDIKSTNQYKTYRTSAITHKATSSWYGFGANLNDLVGIASPGASLPGFLNLGLGLNFAGAYANFDFNNNKNGLNYNELRNIRFDFFGSSLLSPIAQATLKEEMHLNFSTPQEMTNKLNAPLVNIQINLKNQMSQVEAIAKKYATALPGSMSARMLNQVNQMKDAVNYFCNQIPTVSLPSIPNLPVATYIPASDNIELTKVTTLIGQPDDKFDLLKIMDYVNGTRPITLYMLVNFFNDYNNADLNVAEIQDEIARLKAENELLQSQLSNLASSAQYIELTNQINTLVSQYETLPKPGLGGYNGGVWVIAAAIKNPLYETVGNYFTNKYSIISGNPDQGNRDKLAACNTKINEIEAVLATRKGLTKSIQDNINANNTTLIAKNIDLLAAQGVRSGLNTALSQIGVSQEMIDAILAIAPYLNTTADVLNSMNTAIGTVQSYNPWTYPLKASSKTPINSVSVETKLEYDTYKFIYIIK